MKCPICKIEMRKVRWEISNNYKTGKDFKEYDKVTYNCEADDTWVNVETPLVETTKKQPK